MTVVKQKRNTTMLTASTREDPSSVGLQQQPQQATLIDHPISTVATATFAVATPADLNAIPTVVAQLPPPRENDVELQNDESIPVAVATAIRDDADLQQESEPTDCDSTRWRYRYRKEDVSIAFLFCLLVLMGINFVIHSVLNRPIEDEDTSTTFTYYRYPELKLAETIPCQLANTTTNLTHMKNSSHSCYWKQIGSDLIGPSQGDFFGATLQLGGSAEGSRFSVTAPLYSTNRGLTRVYDLALDYSFQQFGHDIVGKHENDALKGIMTDDGHCLILSSVDASLDGHPKIGHFGSLQISSQTGTFVPYGNDMYGKSSLDAFGAAVVNRDGTIVAISDIQYDVSSDESNITNAGVVVLFQYNRRTNTWERLGQQIEGSSTDEYWGRKVSISGDGYTVAIGSRNFNMDQGKVQIYNYDTKEQEWQEVSDLSIVGSAEYEGVAREIELSANGKILAVTSNFISPNSSGTNNTIVQVFEYSENDLQLNQLGNDIVSDLFFESDFGYQVRTSDDGMRIAVSEAKYSPVISSDEVLSAGRVRVFDYIQGVQDWVHRDDINGTRTCDFVGAGFDLSPDGSRLIVGFPNAKGFEERGPCEKDDIGEPEFGIVRLFELQS